MTTLILLTDIIEKIILVLMAILSVWSVSIIIDRKRFFKAHFITKEYDVLKLQIENSEFSFSEKNNSKNFYFQISKSFEQKTTLQVDRAYSSFVKENRHVYEKGLNILATLGANAPFVGLFGTVLGIIRAMAFLGSQTGGSSVVSGVSQALYATAMGLFVAIPAVVAYNIFTNQIRLALQKADSLKDLYIVKANLV